jgi:glycosyltransferase involved in cell wall biosynthesis
MRKDNIDSSATRPAPRTIVFFDHTAALGGGEIALLNLVRAIDHARWRLVVVLGAEGPLADKLRESRIETRVLPLDTRISETRKDSLGGSKADTLRQAAASLAYVARLSQLLRNEGADILHTNSLKADVLGALAGRLARVPVLWHVRDRITDEYLPARAAKVFRLACKYLPQAIAVNSHSTLESLQMPEMNLARVVHDGFAEPGEVQVLARGHGPLIGLVGRISPWKGQDIFIRAAATVRREFPEARFQIIGSAMFGEAEYEAKVRALASELEMGEALEFTGFRSDVEACIASLDILVHASTMGEPFGQVVMEGMAAGKPVVATRGGGVPEIVGEGKSGLLVPMSDAAAMADAILWLLCHPDQARAMGEAGRKRVQENFTIAQTASKVEDLYHAIGAAQAQSAPRKRFRLALVVGAGVALILATRRRAS